MLALQTLADLTDYHLYGVCNTCSRMERLKMLVLYDRLGPEQPIATVSRHLKCSGCGGRDCGIRIVWARAGGVSVWILGNSQSSVTAD